MGKSWWSVASGLLLNVLSKLLSNSDVACSIRISSSVEEHQVIAVTAPREWIWLECWVGRSVTDWSWLLMWVDGIERTAVTLHGVCEAKCHSLGL